MFKRAGKSMLLYPSKVVLQIPCLRKYGEFGELGARAGNKTVFVGYQNSTDLFGFVHMYRDDAAHSLRMILLCLAARNRFPPCSTMEWGLKGGVGLSQITGYWRGSSSTYRVIPSPSAALGVYGQLGVGQRWLLRSELLVSHVTDHYLMRFPFTDAWGNLTDQFATTEIWRNATYLSLPVLFGVRIRAIGYLPWNARLIGIAQQRERSFPFSWKRRARRIHQQIPVPYFPSL
jgi:hypothetical protein